MLVALTRAVSPAIARCELTHLSRQPIDVVVAQGQLAEYEQLLRDAGCAVRRLEAGLEMADSVFVEDIALVFDELAVLTRPGAASRRVESALLATTLRQWRSLGCIAAPATLDGGDVLVLGRDIFVGCSTRTNPEGIEQLRFLLGPFGYRVEAASVTGCLHLKSAVTAVADGVLLINPRWVQPASFAQYELLAVHPDEPHAANALRVGADLIYPSAFPRTRELLEARGLPVRTVDVSELAKAEGAVTCCSLVFLSEQKPARSAPGPR